MAVARLAPAFVVMLALLSQGVGYAADWRQAGGALFARKALPIAAEQDDARDEVLTTPDQPYAVEISRAAMRHGLDPKLLHAVVIVESAYRADARSEAGAVGLTQLMPKTALDLGVVDRFDAEQSLDGGASYLAAQLNRAGDLRLALAAYNAGPGRVRPGGPIPAIKETQVYVRAVVECYLALTAGRAVRSSRTCMTNESINPTFVSEGSRPAFGSASKASPAPF